MAKIIEGWLLGAFFWANLTVLALLFKLADVIRGSSFILAGKVILLCSVVWFGLGVTLILALFIRELFRV